MRNLTVEQQAKCELACNLIKDKNNHNKFKNHIIELVSGDFKHVRSYYFFYKLSDIYVLGAYFCDANNQEYQRFIEASPYLDDLHYLFLTTVPDYKTLDQADFSLVVLESEIDRSLNISKTNDKDVLDFPEYPDVPNDSDDRIDGSIEYPDLPF